MTASLICGPSTHGSRTPRCLGSIPSTRECSIRGRHERRWSSVVPCQLAGHGASVLEPASFVLASVKRPQRGGCCRVRVGPKAVARVTFKVLLSPPDVGELEQEYVLRAMESGWVAPAGPDLNAFEAEVADRCGVAHAVGLSSGTAALHLALVSWGVGAGDVVIAPTFTFAATINAIRYVGAEPHLVDCDVSNGQHRP